MMPRQYKFSQNKRLNDFAEGRVAAAFGDNWRAEATGCLHGVRFEGVTMQFSEDSDSLITSFEIGGVISDPSPLVPADAQLWNTGATRISYFCYGNTHDAPDGTPSTTYYNADGSVKSAYAKTSDGKCQPMSYKEIASRFAAVKRNRAISILQEDLSLMSKPTAQQNIAAINKSQIFVH